MGIFRLNYICLVSVFNDHSTSSWPLYQPLKQTVTQLYGNYIGDNPKYMDKVDDTDSESDEEP